jgi:hypothetical protein
VQTARVQREIERGNLLVAETTLRELGRPTLLELLDLVALIAFNGTRESRPRWLLRWLEQHDQVTIVDAALATACLRAYPG